MSVRSLADGLDATAAQIDEYLDFFVVRGLMMRDGNLLLALATPARPRFR